MDRCGHRSIPPTFRPICYERRRLLAGRKSSGSRIQGPTLINATQASCLEFGVGKSGQKLVALLVYITDVNSLGLEAAQGLLLTEAFYWDMNDETRLVTRGLISDKMKKMPNMGQAGVYSSTLHYLKALEASGTVEASAVMKMIGKRRR